MNILKDIRNKALAAEVEQEVGAVLAGSDFGAWSPACRKSWARSILGIIEGEGLQVKKWFLINLKNIAREGR